MHSNEDTRMFSSKIKTININTTHDWIIYQVFTNYPTTMNLNEDPIAVIEHTNSNVYSTVSSRVTYEIKTKI